ncbi:MAG: TonB-dependent receptor plug, partial [Hyphomonadaceae bacterium]
MTNFKKLVSSCALGVLAIAITAPVAVFAQETTADIRGQIKGAGSPLAGASVVVTHVASGTRATARTDATGGFAVSG